MKVTTETIIRTIVLVVTLLNQTLTMLGKNPLPYSETDIYAFLTTLVTIGATVWAWWKNNSFTKAALQADELMKELKTEGK
jgi:SPP1 family holin